MGQAVIILLDLIAAAVRVAAAAATAAATSKVVQGSLTLAQHDTRYSRTQVRYFMVLEYRTGYLSKQYRYRDIDIITLENHGIRVSISIS